LKNLTLYFPYTLTNIPILQLPRLLRHLKEARVAWPDHREVLHAQTGIEELTELLREADLVLDDPNGFWPTLKRIPTLRKVNLLMCPTIMIAGVAHVSQIKELGVVPMIANLDSSRKKTIAALKDVWITLYPYSEGYPVFPMPTREDAFWRGLKFVTFSEAPLPGAQ
jgi:hypothetical protein